MNIKQFKQAIESTHINFLFGSGLSRPYLQTLGNIENDLLTAEDITDEKIQNIVKTLLYVKYFKGVMSPCRKSVIIKHNIKYQEVLSNYEKFIRLWNNIIAKRSVELLNKQINIFSTNIDNFVEIAAEKEGIEFNDGFKGHTNPTFKEDVFSNIVSKTSTLYHNSSMIPTFNLMKLHGSINWMKKQNNVIAFSKDLHLLNNMGEKLIELEPKLPRRITNKTSFVQLKTIAQIDNAEITKLLEDFRKEYDKLIIVNPHKSKFRETVLDLHFYELMRLFSNALESANTLLIVLGFSFADEHIAKIVLRCANANPTLLAIIFAFDEEAKTNIENNISRMGDPINDNIKIIAPDDYRTWFDEEDKKKFEKLVKFDFKSLNNYVFEDIVK